MVSADKLLKFLRDNRPNFFCPACLALQAGLSLQEAREVIAVAERFDAKTGPCHGCGRSREVVAALSN